MIEKSVDMIGGYDTISSKFDKSISASSLGTLDIDESFSAPKRISDSAFLNDDCSIIQLSHLLCRILLNQCINHGV